MARVVHDPAPILGRANLYMLPTRAGWLFVFVLMAMLLVSVNYDRSLAYLMTFALGAVGLVNMVAIHRNVAGLRLSAYAGPPAFAGGRARFHVELENPTRRARLGISVLRNGRAQGRVDVPAGGRAQVVLEVSAPRRGYRALPTLAVSASFPLGLLFTWSQGLDLQARALVYPRPGPARPLTVHPDRRRYQQLGNLPEGDDFAGLRAYRPGDSPRHIHWKAVASGRGVFTKEFAGAGQETVWLAWDALAGQQPEVRLSQLCRWVLDCETDGLRYGLRLPREHFAPHHGAEHRRACLTALARFGLPRG